MLDARDVKILEALILNGPLTNNDLRRTANLAKATYTRHRDYLLTEGLINRRDIYSRKKNPIRQVYSHEYSITDIGRTLLMEHKLREYKSMRNFIERTDIRSYIEEHLLDTWIEELIEEKAGEEAKYE
jgi:predicted transcriptional regulator